MILIIYYAFRLIADPSCSPQSGHSSSTCESPPPVSAAAAIHSTPNSLPTSGTASVPPTNFTPAWPLIDTQSKYTYLLTVLDTYTRMYIKECLP